MFLNVASGQPLPEKHTKVKIFSLFSISINTVMCIQCRVPENGVVNGCDGSGGIKGQCRFPGDLHLGSADVLLLEQELTVQVAHFDGV